MTNEIIKTKDNTALGTKILELPKYDELTDQRIVKEMQRVFTGFEYDENMQPNDVFKSADQIESYAKNVVSDIETCDNNFKMDAVLKSAAISAKRWHFGFVISKCLDASGYGSDLAGKLAKAAGISTSYLYQYRAVGDRLSMKDAYILGLYGLGWELIRQVAAINDDNIRKDLIKYYVSSITDYNNSMLREQARAAMKQAIDSLKKAPQQLDDSSNLSLIEAASNFSSEAPEFAETEKQVEQLKSAIRGLTKKKRAEPFMKAAGDCYLPESVPGAEEHLEAFIESVTEALELLKELKELLPEYEQELQSLSHLKLLKPDD